MRGSRYGYGQSSVPRILAAAILAFVSLFCCTVKEDRDSCPCNLRLDMGRVSSVADAPVLVALNGERGFHYCETVDLSGIAPDSGSGLSVTVQVPREKISIDVYCPCDAVKDGRVGYRPEGRCDRLLKYSDVIVAEGEQVGCTPVLSKEYCTLTVRLSGNSGVRPPFSLLFKSEIDGYLPGGGLSRGEYVERVDPEGGVCTVNLLRQKDASLMMEIVPSGTEGGVLRSFAIGEYLEGAGYDWNADDLEDVELELDFAATAVRISTDKWTRSVEFNVVI